MKIDPSVTLTPESWRILFHCIQARDWPHATYGRSFCNIVDEAERQVNDALELGAAQDRAFKRRQEAGL